jgi:hypothetical protein
MVRFSFLILCFIILVYVRTKNATVEISPVDFTSSQISPITSWSETNN